MRRIAKLSVRTLQTHKTILQAIYCIGRTMTSEIQNPRESGDVAKRSCFSGCAVAIVLRYFVMKKHVVTHFWLVSYQICFPLQ